MTDHNPASPTSSHSQRPRVRRRGDRLHWVCAPKALSKRFELVGLTRSPRPSLSEDYAEVRRVDLFSRMDTLAGLENVDFAIYLVHSMMPSARLVQAKFADLDLLCADNFAKCAAQRGETHRLCRRTAAIRSHHLRTPQESPGS